MPRPLLLLALLALPATAGAGTLAVHVPNAVIAKATATPVDGPPVEGRPTDGTATFPDLPPDRPLTVRLELKDGTEVQGVDLRWYADLPAGDAPPPPPLTDDDRESIRAIVEDVPSFYNRSSVLHLAGDHARATALVQLVRDTDFHAAGGNVVWRVELYYFQFQYGGWEKVQQQNKVVRRERFKSVDAFNAAVDKIRWVPELGGVTVGKDEAKEVKVAEAGMPKPE